MTPSRIMRAARARIAAQQHRPAGLDKRAERGREVDDVGRRQTRADNSAQTDLRNAKRLSSTHASIIRLLLDLDVLEPYWSP